MKPTCLFTGEELTAETKLEHGIPESLNGKIASRRVTSTAFNEFGGKEFVPEMEAAYKFLINTLAPLMPSQFQKKFVKLDSHSGNVEGPGLMNGGIRFPRPIPQEYDKKTGEPVKFLGPSQAEINKHVSKGKLGKHQWTPIAPELDGEEYSASVPIMTPNMMLGFMISAMIAFDIGCDKADVESFVRDKSLDPLRGAIKVFSITGERPKYPWHKHFVGFQLDRLERLQKLRDSVDFPRTDFEHRLFAVGDFPSRTIDVVWEVFGLEPYGFRLTDKYCGQSFAFCMINGVVKDSKTSRLMPCSQPAGPLCGVSDLGVAASSDADAIYINEAVGQMRSSTYQKVKNVVEQKAQDFVIGELQRVAETEPEPVEILSLVKRRVSRLFPEQAPEKLTEFVDIECGKYESADFPKLTELKEKDQHGIPAPNQWFRFYSDLIAKLIGEFGDCYAYTRYEQNFEEVTYS